MKRLFLFILLITATPSLAQSADPLLFKLWKVGKEKTLSGHQLTKLEGNPIGALTNICFHSRAQMLADIESRAGSELWTAEKKQEQITALEGVAGKITLYLMRHTIGLANTDNFSIIVRSTDDKDLFREDLPADVASPTSGYWSNIGVSWIKGELPQEFFVYVVDRMDSKHPRTKFLVKAGQ